jgi:hypothetical protein
VLHLAADENELRTGEKMDSRVSTAEGRVERVLGVIMAYI